MITDEIRVEESLLDPPVDSRKEDAETNTAGLDKFTKHPSKMSF